MLLIIFCFSTWKHSSQFCSPLPQFLSLYTFLPFLKLNMVIWLALANNMWVIEIMSCLGKSFNNKCIISSSVPILSAYVEAETVSVCAKHEWEPQSTKCNTINLCYVEEQRFKRCLILQHNLAYPYQYHTGISWLIIIII